MRGNDPYGPVRGQPEGLAIHRVDVAHLVMPGDGPDRLSTVSDDRS